MIKDKYLKQLFDNINNSNDLTYIALAVLMVFKCRNSYTDIADLSLILDSDSFINLIEIYGGKTITIPTKEELLRMCNTIMIFYETEFNGLSAKMASKKYNVEYDRAVNYDVNKLKKILSELKVPGRIND